MLNDGILVSASAGVPTPLVVVQPSATVVDPKVLSKSLFTEPVTLAPVRPKHPLFTLAPVLLALVNVELGA